ncbi:MAG: YitT family protein [Bacteroidales bacterium]|nr:YitT family protein [Bacteroidales bacterium]
MLKTGKPFNFGLELKNLAAIYIGIFIYCAGFCAFILPHNIVIGGMAGFSTLVYHATGGLIPVAVTMYGMNILLLILGSRSLGRGFVIRTIFGATLMSLTIGAMEGYFTSHPPLIESAPVSLALGAMMLGFGVGIYYSHHGTCGGTDIVAAIFSQRSNISMGRVMMVVDVSIVALSFFLPFDGDLEARIQVRTQTIIFGWLAIFIYSTLADKYLSDGRQTVQFLIISDKWEEIAERITHETGRGVTLWEGKGYWTGNNRTMLISWCRKVDTPSFYRIVSECDKKAFITTTYVNNIYGNGFDAYKTDKKLKNK